MTERVRVSMKPAAFPDDLGWDVRTEMDSRSGTIKAFVLIAFGRSGDHKARCECRMTRREVEQATCPDAMVQSNWERVARRTRRLLMEYAA